MTLGRRAGSVLVVAGLLWSVAQFQAHGEDGPVFLYRGRLLWVDMAHRSVVPLASFAPDASTVSRDPEGRYWAKSRPNRVAAFDPALGRFVASVSLPYKPFNHLGTEDGMLCVSHHTVTPGGFTASVVDTRTAALVGEIGGIPGLRTDLIEEAGVVFMATIGVGKDDYLTSQVSRIDPQRFDSTTIFRSTDTRYFLRLAANSGLLYICLIPRADSSLESWIRVLDVTTGAGVREIAIGALAGPGLTLRQLAFSDGHGYLICRDGSGRFRVTVTNLAVTELVKSVPVPGAISRLVGIAGREIVYLDDSDKADTGQMLLRFVETGGGKEVKSIALPGLQ